jgi:hypothetical protein
MVTAKTVVTAPPVHYLWWFPGSPVKVHLALSVVERLKRRLSDAGASNSEGLLFGGTQDGATEILDFQPATNTSPASMVSGLTAERQRSLVGYYRTEEGEAFRLNAQDAALAKECFAKPYNVFLIVHLDKFGPPTATFFFHDRDCRMADFAFLEFPFDPSLLAAQQNDRIQRSQDAQSGDLLPGERSLAVTPAPVSAAAGALRRMERRGFVKAAGWTCSLALVFAVGMYFSNGSLRDRYSYIWRAISNRPSSPPSGKGSLSSDAQSPGRPSISLRAIRRNADLELTWNRDSDLIVAATSGTLWIQEGESTRQVSFDAAELRDGSLLYSPRTDQILMRLTVTTPTDTVTESVRVILPAVGEPQAFPIPPLKNPSGSLAISPAPPHADLPIKPTKAFTAPLLAKGTSSPASPILQDPPAMNSGLSAPADLPSAALPIALDRLPGSPPAPAARPSHQLLPSPKVTTYEPPVAVVKTQPAFPPELRNLIGKRMVVEVKLTIDKNGKVFKAEAIPQGNISKYWLNSAVDAALTWKFKPARSNSEPVWSEAIVQFVFNR